MRRPGMTREQRQHAKEQRALLQLRKVAVRWSIAMDDEADTDSNVRAFLFADLGAACDKYREALGVREARKLAK